MSFVEQHALWSVEQKDAAKRIESALASGEIDLLRFAFADQHGLLRGKALLADDARSALRSGVTATTTILAKDSAHRTVYPVFTAGGGFGMAHMEGGADFLMIPDPLTFRVLPWAEKTGWVLCDQYFPDGSAVPFSTRGIYKAALDDLAARGYDFVAGLEVEFHVFRLADPKLAPQSATQPCDPPDVGLLSHGYQYLSEQRFDLIEPVVEFLRRDILALGLPLRSVEVEFGPSQFEFTFGPTRNLAPADLMILFRSAVKQICRRHGYHATFMCRPKIQNTFASGWHLHQSLARRDGGANAFMPADKGEILSDTGRHYLAGLLDHALPATVFSTPTINGYKRYRTYSLAPDRAIWGRDNRGVMLRVLGGPGQAATRIENRVGEPAANPYLYMASQIVSGLDGIDRRLEPGPSADTPYETRAPLLPRSLREALDSLKADSFFGARFGKGFVDYYAFLKEAELARFQQEVTDWEQREYFEMF
ncbi:MAG: glutamine synthetase [Pseudorhodoplanes sp.]|nr:glutamine synthetase [Pseudorhodoplanes sp.]